MVFTHNPDHNQFYGPWWAERLKWEKTQDKHIYLCLSYSRYHFVDETEQFDTTPYPTFTQCKAAMAEYCKTL